MTDSPRSVVVFGASGAIGSAIARWHLDRGARVLAAGRGEPPRQDAGPRLQGLQWNPERPDQGWEDVEPGGLHAAIWAQGANTNDSITAFDLAVHERIYAANVTYILLSLDAMLRRNLLASGARLCVISSIWQDIARQNKLSYTISKSALKGLVQSFAIDLGVRGMLVNAVLPGALDTPMTRANLSPDQIARLEEMTPLGRLPELADVSRTVGFLCSTENTGITGQFIAVDKGFSYARIV